MQIVSASRRTDIPAFYTPWLMARLRAGHARVPNPFNSRQISTVDLRPEGVAALFLWTKDPRHLLPHLEELENRGYRTVFHVTMTGLPRALEPHVPPVEAVAAAVREISRRIGPGRLVWRFDPVILSPGTSEKGIISTFEALSRVLEGAVRQVTVSFARPYRQVLSRLRRGGADGFAFPDLTQLPPEEALSRIAPVSFALAEIAAKRGLPIFSCAERLDLTPLGIRPGACIDRSLIREEFGLDLLPRKDPGQRPECRCLRSVDIGMYGSCGHGCLYCYARGDSALGGGNVHDPRGAMLLGGEKGGEDQPGLF